MKPILSLLILLLNLFCAQLLCAAESPSADDNIHIKADSMEHAQSDGNFTAIGNVQVTWQGMNLVADRATYNSNTHLLNAYGNVTIARGNDLLKGETLSLDLESGLAEMDKATMTMPGTNLSFKGDRIVRENESEFKATSTELTTCDLPDPSWKFGADSLKVNVLGYATGRNVVFYVKDVPVLYLPWIAFPVVRDKKSGVLFPRLGYSNSRGAQLDLPIYWVISPSQDLLFDLDLMTKRGVGTGFDYRYIRARGSEGNLAGYQIYDTRKDSWRWQISQNHKEIFSPDANLRTEVNLSSDRAFHSDFGEKSGEYNQQFRDTSVNALKTWRNYALSAHLRYNEDLYASDNSNTLQTLPSVSFAGVRQSLFNNPLFFDVDAEMANLYRETEPSGQRLHIFPKVTYQVSPGGYFQASFSAGTHLRGYSTDRRSPGTAIKSSDGDLVPEVGARISTSVVRGFDVEAEHLKKARHEIVPEITYSYIPDRSQQRLPFYDYNDRLLWQNMLGLSVTSLLNGKFVNGETSEYREISRLKLMLGYSFEGKRRDLLTLVDTQRPWSDLILESDTWLDRNVKLTFDSRYNLYDKRLSTVAAGLEVDDRQGNSAGASYHLASGKLEYLEGRIATRYLKPVYLSYLARYSFDRGDFLESVYSAEYRHKCWSVNAALRQRPGSYSYTMNFNLAGLGGK